jgi:hypothetical protein
MHHALNRARRSRSGIVPHNYLYVGLMRRNRLPVDSSAAAGRAGFCAVAVRACVLERALDDELCRRNRAVLADAVAARGGLILDARVPPGIWPMAVSAAARLRLVPPASRLIGKSGTLPALKARNRSPPAVDRRRLFYAMRRAGSAAMRLLARSRSRTWRILGTTSSPKAVIERSTMS